MEQIIAYKPKCGCRDKTFRTKSGCLSHERYCIYNPDNHACPTCLHNDNAVIGCELDVLSEHLMEKYVHEAFVPDEDGNDKLVGIWAKNCPYWKLDKGYKRYKNQK